MRWGVVLRAVFVIVLAAAIGLGVSRLMERAAESSRANDVARSQIPAKPPVPQSSGAVLR